MRNKNFIIIAAIVTLLLIAAIVLTLLYGNSRRGEEEPINPFGETGDTRPIDTNNGNTEGSVINNFFIENTVETTDITAPKLRLVSDKPVSGGTVVYTKNEEYVRYVDTMTGNVLETPIKTIAPADTKSGDTNLRVGNVLWSDDGEVVLLQRLDALGTTLYSYLGTLISTTTSDGTGYTSRLVGRHLPDDILTATLAPDGSSVFYIVAADNGSVGYLETIVAGTRTEVWSSPLRSVTATWSNDDNILVYTKPSSVTQGYVWIVDPDTQASEVIFGDKYALAVKMSPEGDKMLYSFQETSVGHIALGVLDTETGESTQIPLSTIAEKCAWGPQDSSNIYCAIPNNITEKIFLENWYYGALQADDTLWQINTVSGSAERILTPVEETTDTFDIIDLVVSPDEDYVIFRTRENTLLWSLEIPIELRPSNIPVEEVE